MKDNRIRGINDQKKVFSSNLRSFIAILLYLLGIKHSVSTFIDEDTIIAGYGSLNRDFYYPLPTSYVRKIYGTTSWANLLRRDKNE